MTTYTPLLETRVNGITVITQKQETCWYVCYVTSLVEDGQQFNSVVSRDIENALRTHETVIQWQEERREG